ncbi:MAG: YebC/PmpR family DNA-binding transcriptional regulator [Candidatus Eremiobacteraeota bacterium]|nr:YebC/PmpR family DNA-binding transcriptional regulator [Candidatus Eremiobacteraeota bacterium]
MSGHSKWHNIRLRKGKVDAQRGALFTKLSKEIILAAKSGSPDPEANYRLKMAVDKARENNVPQDNIKRAIARGSAGSGEKDIEELRYEGYGPHGIAVVLDAATDNRNRTAGEMRFLFSKNGGVLGEAGSVGWMFESVGIVVADAGGRTEDELLEMALVDGVIDMDFDERAEIFTEPTALSSAREALSEKGLHVSEFYLGMRPKVRVALQGGELSEALHFLDALDAHEDAQHLFSNLEITQAALESFANA